MATTIPPSKTTRRRQTRAAGSSGSGGPASPAASGGSPAPAAPGASAPPVAQPDRRVIRTHLLLARSLHGKAPTGMNAPISWNRRDGFRALANALKAAIPNKGAPRP